MSRSCKLPDCYPTSVNSFNLDDTFQNVNTEATFYGLDSNGNESEADESEANESEADESVPADIINSNVVRPTVTKHSFPTVTKHSSPSTTMETQRELEVTNSVITNQMKSERWINGISNTTILIIILILLLIIILKK